MTPTKILSLFLCFCLILEQSVFAQTIDLSHYFARNSASAVTQSDKFRPLHLRYISYDNQANDFKILLDKGDFFNQKTEKPKNEKTLELENTTQELMKYFFIGLSLPNEKFWVNLRPDSPDNILDPELEKTDIGRIFLEADLQLKKDTSSMTSPQNPEGKAYWDKLYKKAGELFGNENITIPTITRPWIVPNEIIIREAPDNAYIYKATLKVMLEEDYLTSRGGSRTAPTPDQYTFSDPRLKELNQYSTQLIKETIIPKLTYAVNTSKRYAQLRQVYYSLILAQWFKQKYGSVRSASAPGHLPAGRQARALVNSYIDLIDSGNLANLTSKEPYDKQTYFQQYQKSFKYGEYNLQEPVYTPMGQSIRRYTSGGAVFDGIPKVMSQGRVNSSLELSPALISKNMQMNISSPLDPDDISNTKKTSVVSSAAEGGFDLDDGSICRIEPLTKDLADQRYNEILDLVNTVSGSNWGKDKLIEEYSGKWQNSFVVVRDKKIVAILLAYEQEPNAELKIGDRHIFIRRLCVAEEFRRKHIAIHLLNYLSSQVKAKGYRPIALQINVDNAEGNLLYRKLDFTNVATIKAGEHRDNIYVIDAIKLSHTTQNVIMESVNPVIREENQDIFGLERVNYLGNVAKGKVNLPEFLKNIMYSLPWPVDMVKPEAHISNFQGLVLKPASVSSYREHQGIDMQTSPGDKVFAAAEGIVAYVDDFEKNGKISDRRAFGFVDVYIYSPDKRLLICYVHLDKESVPKDILKHTYFDILNYKLKVRAGEVIGAVKAWHTDPAFSDNVEEEILPAKVKECYGRSYNHLHFEVLYVDDPYKLNSTFSFSGFEAVNPLLLLKPLYKIGKENDFVSAMDKQYIEGSTNSPVTSNDKGGIAFNALPIQTESVASSALGVLPGGRVFNGDLDAEWARIQDVFNAGIRPSILRLSEYTAAASASPLAEDKIDQVRVMLADILRREEEDEKIRISEPGLKKLLSDLESDTDFENKSIKI